MWYAIAIIAALMIVGAMWFASRASAQAPSVGDAASPLQKAIDAVKGLTGDSTPHALDRSGGGTAKGAAGGTGTLHGTFGGL